MVRKVAASTAVPNATIEELQALFGANARRARLKSGMTQIEVAQLTGLTQQYVGKIENGQKNVTLSTMKILADAYGVVLTKLLR